MLPKWLLTLSAVSQLLFGLSAVRQARGDNAGAHRPLREATEIAAAEPTMRGYRRTVLRREADQLIAGHGATTLVPHRE
jgi:hypothetical protein